MKIDVGKAVSVALPALGVFTAILLPYLVRNAYVAMAGMFAISIGIFLLSKKLDGALKAFSYGSAFACLILAAGVPSGEVGHAPCPERVYLLGNAGTVSYFQSPFCPNCGGLEEALVRSARERGLEVRAYDIRYCKGEASKYGFYATPCFAVDAFNKTERSCGMKTNGEVNAILDGALRNSAEKSDENQEAE